MPLVSPSWSTIIWSSPTARLRALHVQRLGEAQALSRPSIAPISPRRRLAVWAEHQSPTLHLISVQGDTWLAGRFILGLLGLAHFAFREERLLWKTDQFLRSSREIRHHGCQNSERAHAASQSCYRRRFLVSGFVSLYHICGAIETSTSSWGKEGCWLLILRFAILTLHGAWRLRG
jgi:hypothetical protein